MKSIAHSLRLVFSRIPATLQASVNRGTTHLTRQAAGGYILTVRDGSLDPGPPATIVALTGDINCSFFLRDVNPDRPMVARDLGLAVTAMEDTRTFMELLDALGKPPGLPDELCMDEGMASCPGMVAPVWLGLGGDARVFLVSHSEDHGCWGCVIPFRYHKNLFQNDDEKVEWDFCVGRGSQYRHEITRRLEEGVLPIVHSKQSEPSIEYDLVMFATVDTCDMAENPPRGTNWQAAYLSCMGCMYPKDKQDELDDLLRSEMVARADQPVYCLQVTARNTGKAPAYAWYRMPMYKPGFLPPMYPAFAEANKSLVLDPHTGLCLEGNRVFSLNRLNGGALPNEEISVLVEPGASVVFEAYVPFVPIPKARLKRLREHTFQDLHRDCREYWVSRLAGYPRWKLPESGLDERLRAGVQHLAMNTLGERERKDSPLLATVGVYAPIGTESTPILWFLDSMGQHDTVRRCLDYFFAVQREDGYIQSFNFYDAETGPVLGNVWRHFLITGDRDWALRIQDGVRRGCYYLIERRRKEMAGQTPGSPGFGMISGKTADPDEYFSQFVLNAQAADGLAGAVKLLRILGDDVTEINAEAEALKETTRRGFDRAWADAPLVPTAEGDWVPMIGPWPGPRGEVSLYAERDRWFTHGSFHMRALMFLHLVCWNIIEADDWRIAALMRGLEHNVLLDFTGPSQPYGRRSDFWYAATGQVEKFTQLFYRQVARLQDRETYTFWEHYYKLSSQKTHEEAWFLQQMSWMICFEEGGGLTLLKMAPLVWFSPGGGIQIEAIHTCFGTVSLEMKVNDDLLTVRIGREDGPILRPERLGLRIPRSIFGEADIGSYNSGTEILDLDPRTGDLRFKVKVERESGQIL
jgi:hypothetical protein